MQSSLQQQKRTFLSVSMSVWQHLGIMRVQMVFEAWFTWSPTVCMLVALMIGFLVSGIFSGEKRYHAASVYFASYHGRKKAVLAKIEAGIFTVTLLYWGTMLLYSGIVLGCLGVQGSQCLIQTQFGNWKSFYEMTIGQEFLCILLGGYIGCLFFGSLTMLISAWSNSGTAAAVVPFILILAPSFLVGTQIHFLDKILGLLPDQMLQMEGVISGFSLYSIGANNCRSAANIADFLQCPVCRTFACYLTRILQNKRSTGVKNCRK